MADLCAVAALQLLDAVPAGHHVAGSAPAGPAPSEAGWVAQLSFALALLATTVLLFAAARGRRRRSTRSRASRRQDGDG